MLGIEFGVEIELFVRHSIQTHLPLEKAAGRTDDQHPARLEPNYLIQLVPDAVPAPCFQISAEPIMIDVNLFGVSHSSFPSLFRRPASDSMPPMAIKSATCSISPRAIGAGQRDAQICRAADRLE